MTQSFLIFNVVNELFLVGFPLQIFFPSEGIILETSSKNIPNIGMNFDSLTSFNFNDLSTE
jgi:hypothetical protein